MSELVSSLHLPLQFFSKPLIILYFSPLCCTCEKVTKGQYIERKIEPLKVEHVLFIVLENKARKEPKESYRL
jgi:hypothetical protein